MVEWNIVYGNISVNEGARLMGLGATLYEVFLVIIGTGFAAATYVVVDYFVNGGK